ncbi:MAG: hypothetical protein WD066_18830 [Planctomycetaceae bacterium]
MKSEFLVSTAMGLLLGFAIGFSAFQPRQKSAEPVEAAGITCPECRAFMERGYGRWETILQRGSEGDDARR